MSVQEGALRLKYSQHGIKEIIIIAIINKKMN